MGRAVGSKDLDRTLRPLAGIRNPGFCSHPCQIGLTKFRMSKSCMRPYIMAPVFAASGPILLISSVAHALRWEVLGHLFDNFSAPVRPPQLPRARTPGPPQLPRAHNH